MNFEFVSSSLMILIFPFIQEVLLWIKSVVSECGENVSKDQLKDYIWKTLNSGKVWFHYFVQLLYLMHQG